MSNILWHGLRTLMDPNFSSNSEWCMHGYVLFDLDPVNLGAMLTELSRALEQLKAGAVVVSVDEFNARVKHLKGTDLRL